MGSRNASPPLRQKQVPKKRADGKLPGWIPLESQEIVLFNMSNFNQLNLKVKMSSICVALYLHSILSSLIEE
ncbi:hypothetical protein A3193_18690 [Candidatus Thiodiazotropha endoloripes]|nr:hypothetical protein A3193_18690 [Candidatus Thiodiazotropha endoloripes]